uniref:ATP synthase F0 subunit 6 n=1 Tax=Stroggylocephalus agrestis TaxID=3112133 RepID=UPI002E785699|nr:ATP synthase F0 subunit 6 [Stroggylocephalus agrestis]WRK21275.1 ATP synthase F0 subunit 6 [Stroggylocephalus agrestis]
MMTNLFSTFDPSTGVFSMNWISMMIPMSIMPMSFWLLPNKNLIFMNLILKNLFNEMKMLMKYNGMQIFMLSMFIIILFSNIMGLMPYVFTSSSHLVFSLTMALPMWLSFMLFGWMNKTNSMFSHLTPIGTPSMLMPLMVIIETISNFIRPTSLSVRLTANMIAGHLIMSLLGESMQSLLMIFLMMFMFLLMMMFEAAVAMIQSYVFMTLTNLYSSEI